MPSNAEVECISLNNRRSEHNTDDTEQPLYNPNIARFKPSNYNIKLHDGENILYVQKPQYTKNVLILFCGLLIITTLLFIFVELMLTILIPFDSVNAIRIIKKCLMYMTAAFYIIIVLYMLCYKLLHKKLTNVYVLTTERAIIVDAHGVHSWPYHEISEIVFCLHKPHNNSDGPDTRTEREKEAGSIYFGYKIENYTLPFSIMSYAVCAGFVMIPSVYEAIDIIMEQCRKCNPSNVIQTRMIVSESELEERKLLISKANALCGMRIFFCCLDTPLTPGKISEQTYRRLMLEISGDPYIV